MSNLKMRLLVFIIGIILYAFCHANADEISRHEIRTDVRWTSEDYFYDDYIVNREPVPGVSGHFETEYWLISSSYTFFLTPVTEDEETPISLRRFYEHPTAIRVFFSVQPETETTYIYQNRENNYRLSTFKDKRSRSAGLEFEYYPWNNTGILLSLSSAKNEEDSRTSNTLDDRGVGENNEIRRYYEFGISQYFLPSLNVKLTYTTFDFEYVGVEKTWEQNSPLLSRENGRETDTDGRKILLTGEYIFRKFLGIRGFYEFWDQKGHSDVFTSYYENFSDSEYYYDAETTNQTLGTFISLYLWNKTTFRVGGSFAWQENERVHEIDQINEYDWKIKTVATEISYYVNQYIGVQVGYEYAKREGEMLIWHPEAEGDPRTEYQADSDLHEIYVGITGRF